MYLLASGERPDLILMDIQLPGMDGLAATELLKRDPVTAAIPVIALTAMAMTPARAFRHDQLLHAPQAERPGPLH